MSYSPSKIGQQLSVNAQLSQRNSFKILDSQEYEIPAIDFEKLGVNTIAPKDRTIITDLEYADVDSIAGEISPGNAVSFDGGISSAWVNNTKIATQLTDHGDTDEFIFTPHVYQEDAFSNQSQNQNVQTDFAGVPQFIDVIIQVPSKTIDGTDITVLIPKIPVIGTCSLYRNHNNVYDEEQSWSSNVCTSLVATLYTQYGRQDKLVFNNTAIAESFPTINGGSRTLTANLRNTHVLYANDREEVAQYLYKELAGELCEAFRVSFNTNGSNQSYRPQFTIRYRIVPIAGIVRNSLSDTLAADSSTSLVGRQHFYAIPESVSKVLATDFIVTNTRTTVWHTEDSYDMYTKLLGKVGNTSIYLACKVQSNEPSDYCSYGLAMKSDAVGRIVFPSNGEWIVEKNVSSPNSSVSLDSIKTIDVSDADGKEDYLVALSIGDKKYVIALSSVRASYVNPLAYGNSSLVPVDPLIVSNTILSKPSQARVELSMTQQFSPYSIVKKSWWYFAQYTPNLPGMKDVDGKLFVGSHSAISRSIGRRLLATYGQQNFAFVDKIFSNAHFESYAASSVYNSVDVFPVLYPSYSLYSNLAIKEPSAFSDIPHGDTTKEHFQFSTGLSFYNVHNDSGLNTWGPLGAIPFGWTNGTPVTSGGETSIVYTCSYKLGTVLIVNLPAVDRYGTPEQVMFTQDVIGAEFLNSTIVHGTSQVLTSTRYVATDTALYRASDLYHMSTVKNNSVYIYGKASKGFLSIAQFVFVVGESVTHIFSEDRNGIVCLGSVAGAVAQDPVISATGMMMASVEKNAVVLYSVSQGNIMPIKRITYTEPYTATALLKFVSGVGLILAVRVPGATFMYLVTDRACSLAAYIPNTSSLACTDLGGVSSILHTVYNDANTYTVLGLEKQPSFTIRSSAFAFPLIEGMKCLLVGMKLHFEPTTTNNSFGLIVSANNRVVKAATLLPCEIENVIMFDKQSVVGTAAYTISNCSGRLRNVSWLVSPMPIVQDTIERPPIPANQLEVIHSGPNVTMTLQCPTKLIWELSCSDN